MARIKPFIRVRYTGPGVTLGVYGRIEPGEVFSMKRQNWEYLEDGKGGVPKTFEKVGEAEENLPKETPAVVEASPEAGEGVGGETNTDTSPEDQDAPQGQPDVSTGMEKKIPKSRKKNGKAAHNG